MPYRYLLFATLFLSILSLSLVSGARADIPAHLSYQGRLTNDLGNPLDTMTSITFKLYADDGVTQLWSETHPAVTVVDGLFGVLLGQWVPLTPDLFDGSIRLLGVQVGDGPEGDNLMPIVSAAYALRSAKADTAAYALAAPSGGGGGGWVDDGGTVRLESAGDDVGIGTDAPGAKLEINGDTRADGNLTITADLRFEGSSSRVDAGFITFDTARVRIDGAVALGGPHYSHKQVSISQHGIKDTIPLWVRNEFGTTAAFYSQSTGSGYPSTPHALYAYAGGEANGLRVGASGDGYGIFTRSDGAGNALHADANGTGYAGYFEGGLGVGIDGNLNVSDSLKLSLGAFDGWVLTSDAVGNASWQALPTGSSPWTENGSSVYLNDPDLNVGVGTSTPVQKLTVAGNFLSTGKATFGGGFQSRKTVAAYCTGTLDTFAVWGYNSNGTAAGFYSATSPNVAPGTPSAVYARSDSESVAGIFQSMGNGFGLTSFSAGTRDAFRAQTTGSSYAGRFIGGLGVKVDGDLSVAGTTAGDGSVALPEGAIGAPEIFDEPGVAAAFNPNSVYLHDMQLKNVVTVTLTTPSDGYVHVEGHSIGAFFGSTYEKWVYFYIDTSLVEEPAFEVKRAIIGCESFPTDGEYYQSAYVSDMFYLPAGSHTFALRARATAYLSIDGYADAYRSSLVATFYPTSYGSVTTTVSGAEASDFQRSELIESENRRTGETEQFYQVDLRELELRAVRARAEAERTERELLEARLRELDAAIDIVPGE